MSAGVPVSGSWSSGTSRRRSSLTSDSVAANGYGELAGAGDHEVDEGVEGGAGRDVGECRQFVAGLVGVALDDAAGGFQGGRVAEAVEGLGVLGVVGERVVEQLAEAGLAGGGGGGGGQGREGAGGLAQVGNGGVAGLHAV